MKIGTSKVSQNYAVAIPIGIREALAIKVGDVLVWSVVRSDIVVEKKLPNGNKVN